jgi:hypothetical protein
VYNTLGLCTVGGVRRIFGVQEELFARNIFLNGKRQSYITYYSVNIYIIKSYQSNYMYCMFFDDYAGLGQYSRYTSTYVVTRSIRYCRGALGCSGGSTLRWCRGYSEDVHRNVWGGEYS